MPDILNYVTVESLSIIHFSITTAAPYPCTLLMIKVTPVEDKIAWCTLRSITHCRPWSALTVLVDCLQPNPVLLHLIGNSDLPGSFVS
jgi:hypothetical protein